MSQSNRNNNVTAMTIASHIQNNENVMLEGVYGTGKTAVVLEAVKKLGLNMVHLDASLVDPYVDIVGIPQVVKNEDGTSRLEQVRKDTLMNAEVIFVDEFNRGESATLNGMFQLIQFGTINGEKLVNLKSVIAAMNPADNDDYKGVDELDSALLDRFDFFYTVEPFYDIRYYTKAFNNKVLATSLVQWATVSVNQKKAGYISPRRLEKIGLAYSTHADKKKLQASFPPRSNLSVNDLWNIIKNAEANDKKSGVVKGGSAPRGKRSKIDFNDLDKRSTIVNNIEFLTKNYDILSANQKQELSNTISKKVGVDNYKDLKEIILKLNVDKFTIKVTNSKYSALSRKYFSNDYDLISKINIAY